MLLPQFSNANLGARACVTQTRLVPDATYTAFSAYSSPKYLNSEAAALAGRCPSRRGEVCGSAGQCQERRGGHLFTVRSTDIILAAGIEANPKFCRLFWYLKPLQIQIICGG